MKIATVKFWLDKNFAFRNFVFYRNALLYIEKCHNDELYDSSDKVRWSMQN